MIAIEVLIKGLVGKQYEIDKELFPVFNRTLNQYGYQGYVIGVMDRVLRIEVVPYDPDQP